MKKNALRRASFFALALLTLILSACSSGSLAETAVSEEASVTAAPVKEGKTVKEPFSRAELEALPVATADMSEDQLRAIVVEFYRMQGSIPWLSRQEIKFPVSGHDEPTRLSANTIYCGLPYTGADSSLYNFLDYYDDETGVFTNRFGVGLSEVLGNHCAGSVFWAWARVSSTVNYKTTNQMNAAHGLVKVGNYAIDESVENFSNPEKYHTGVVCDVNGLDVMCEAYACLKPGDGVVVYNDSKIVTAHHAMLAVETSVTRRADGKVDPDASTVAVYQQDNRADACVLESGQRAYSIAPMGKVYTFRKLFASNYIPVTVQELAGVSPVQKAAASVNFEGETMGEPDLRALSVSANYCISKVTLTARNEAGEVVKETVAYGRSTKYELDLASSGLTLCRALSAGAYRFTVTALVGSGETLTAFDGGLTI